MNRSIVFAAVAVAACAALSARADIVQVDVSGVLDKDVVFESGGSASAFGGHSGAGQSYVVDGYNGANGLPASGVVASPGTMGNYQLRPYNGNNVTEISGLGSPEEQITITLPQYQYSSIGMLVAAANGDVSLGYRLNFSDATSQDWWWGADDWWSGDVRAENVVALGGMDNLNIGDGAVWDVNSIKMFEFVIPVDVGNQGKTVTSLTLYNNDAGRRWTDGGNDAWAGVFAVNGSTVNAIPEPASAALIGIAAVGLYTFRRRR